MRPAPVTVALAHRQEAPALSFAYVGTLPASAIWDSHLNQKQLVLLPEVFDRSQRFVRGAGPLLQERAFWPRKPTVAADNGIDRLFVPGQNFFALQEKSAVQLRTVVPLPTQAQPVVGAGRPIEDNVQSISIDASTAKRAIPGSQPALRSALY
jgi:hypothetical protein